MVNNLVVHALTPQDLGRARDMFTERINSLENDTKRCFYGIFEPGAPGPAFFPAIMYCFATLDYFSSFWAGWNQRAPQGQSQTDRMVAFGERYLLYPRREAQIAIHFWRHKLMHTAEPRPLRDSVTDEAYSWSTGSGRQDHMQHNHMRLAPTGAKRSTLHFSPVIFVRDLREGIFCPDGYFQQLSSEEDLQQKYRRCLAEFENYKITLKP